MYIAQAQDLGITGSYTPSTIVVVDPMSGKVTSAGEPLPVLGLYQVTIAVKSIASLTCSDRSSSNGKCVTTGSGCSKTIIDFM